MIQVAHPRGGFGWFCQGHFEYVTRIDIRLGVELDQRYRSVGTDVDDSHDCLACMGVARSTRVAQ